MSAWGLIGHGRAERALRGAIRAGRLPPACLITGPPGIGRRTLAIRLAQALWCEGDPQPCFACAACRRLADEADFWRVAVRRGHPDEPADPRRQRGERGAGTTHVLTGYFDLDVLRRADGARDIPIDGIREFAAQLHLKPAHSAVRIGLIDEAHLMNQKASDALLKTLEESAGHALMVLIAPRVVDVRPTVASRCRQIDLPPVPADVIAAHLAGALQAEPDTATAIAEAARGRPGWAIHVARDPAAWQANQERTSEAEAFEAADPYRRFAAVPDFLGRGRPLEQAERAYAWLDALQSVQAGYLRVGLREAAADVTAADDADLRRTVQRLLRVRETRTAVLRNVTPRLACEDLALRPEGFGAPDSGP